MKRIPSLDGLRAVSIALVLLGHLNGTKGFGSFDLGIGDYAHLGVLVFFVISGYLITGMLLAEHQRTGGISLKRFYARRTLRLFPACYAYVLAMWALSLIGLIHLHTRDIVQALTYTVNYFPNRSWQIGQLWSLSVEEQFYLLWPLAFVIAKPRKAAWVAVAVVALGPVSRSLAWLFLRHTSYYDMELFPTLADSLAFGCLLAMVGGWLERQNWYRSLFHPAAAISMVVAIMLINRYSGYTLVSVPGTSIVYAFLAVLIHRCVCIPDDTFGRFLNWKPVAFIGTLSYSLYLWQQPFLNRNSAAWINRWPQNIVFAVATALASYFLLEKPFLALRSRLRQREPEAAAVH